MALNHRRMSIALISSFILEAINKLSPLIVIHHAQKTLGLVEFGWGQYQLALVEILQPLITYGFINFAMAEAGKIEEPQPAASKPEHVYTQKFGVLADLFSHILILKLAHAALLLGVLALWQFSRLYLEDAPTLSWTFDPGSLWIAAIVLIASVLDGLWVMIVKGYVAQITLATGVLRLMSLGLILTLIDGPLDRELFVFLSLLPNLLIAGTTGIYALRRHAHFFIKKTLLIKIFRLSTPFALVVLASAFFDRMDIVIVKKFLGFEAAGLYAGPAKLVQSLCLMIGSLSVPFYAEAIKTRDPSQLTKQLTLSLWLLMAMISPMIVGSAFVERPILDLIFTDLPPSADGVLKILSLGMIGAIFMATFGLQILLSQSRAWDVFLGLGLGITLTGVLTLLFRGSLTLHHLAFFVVIGKFGAGVFCLFKSMRGISFVPWSALIKPLLSALFMGLILHVAGPFNLTLTLILGALAYLFGLVLISLKEIRILLALKK